MSRKFLFNSKSLVLGNIIENTTLFLLNYCLIKKLGTSAHGTFTYFTSLMILIKIGVDLGLASHITKLISKNGNSRKVYQAAILFIGLHLLTASFIFLGAHWISEKEIFAGASFFALWFTGLAFYTLAISIFNGHQNMHHSFLIILLFEGLKVSSILYLWFAQSSMESFLRFIGLGNIIVSFFTLIAVYKLGGPWKRHPSVFPLDTFSHLRESTLLWIPTGIILLLPQLLNVIIGSSLSKHDVSVFSTLLSWSMLSFVILTPLASVLFSHVGTTQNQSLYDRALLYNSYYRITGTLSYGVALLLLLAAPVLLKIYGAKFESQYTIFTVLLAAQMVEFTRFFAQPILSGGPNVVMALRIEATRFITSVGLASFVIVLGGTTLSVAWALVATQLIFSIVRLELMKKIHNAGSQVHLSKLVIGFFLSIGIFHMPLPYTLKTIVTLALWIFFSGIRTSDIHLVRNIFKLKSQ